MSQISKGKVLDAAELFYDSDTGKLLEVRADWSVSMAVRVLSEKVHHACASGGADHRRGPQRSQRSNL